MTRRERKGTPLTCMRAGVIPGEPECVRRAAVVVERRDEKTFSVCRACYHELALERRLVRRLYPV